MLNYKPFDKRRVALISVYDKTGIDTFAKQLAGLGWIIVSSGGTAKYIAKAGVDVVDAAELVGGDAILGHRVVTLSREIHAGLLADPNDAEHDADMKKEDLPYIHMVVNDMYPLEEEIANPEHTLASVIEKTDIGGPTMLRSAAKAGRIVLSSPDQREEVITWLSDGRPDEAEFIDRLAARAEYETARYIMASAIERGNGEFAGFIGRKQFELKYGENAGRDAAVYTDNRINIDPLGIDQFEQVKGGPISMVGLTDVDRAVQTAVQIAAGFAKNFKTIPTAIAVGNKHGNACGASFDEDPVVAVQKMLEGDQRAIFGGTVLINGPITKEIATVMMRHDIDKEAGNRILATVIGASIEAEALEVFRSKRLIVFTNPALRSMGLDSLDTSEQFRQVRGGFIAQDPSSFVIDFEHPQIVGAQNLSDEQKQVLTLGWGINSTSNSNTITLTRDNMLIGNGVGQQDRVGAVELAAKRAHDAGHETTDSALVSDSFFPFPDGPQIGIDNGAGIILATSGSVRDDEVRSTVEQSGTLFVTIPDKIGRGFFAH